MLFPDSNASKGATTHADPHRRRRCSFLPANDFVRPSTSGPVATRFFFASQCCFPVRQCRIRVRQCCIRGRQPGTPGYQCRIPVPSQLPRPQSTSSVADRNAAFPYTDAASEATPNCSRCKHMQVSIEVIDGYPVENKSPAENQNSTAFANRQRSAIRYPLNAALSRSPACAAAAPDSHPSSLDKPAAPPQTAAPSSRRKMRKAQPSSVSPPRERILRSARS